MSEAPTFEEAMQVVARYFSDEFREDRYSLLTELPVDDWETVAAYVNSRFSEDERSILYVHDRFRAEFTKGHRCSVCGRTKAQNEALGYDCVREC